MPVTHEPWLVALSLVVAIQGAYVGLSLAVQVRERAGLRRRLLLAGGRHIARGRDLGDAFRRACSRRGCRSRSIISSFPTLLSFLVCVIVVGVGGFRRQRRAADRRCGWPPPPIFMGGGIAIMHYIGMTALHASAHMTHAPDARGGERGRRDRRVRAGALAGRRPRPAPAAAVSAAALGIAIAGMHYTAMAGVTIFPPCEHGRSARPALSTDLLAIVVADRRLHRLRRSSCSSSCPTAPGSRPTVGAAPRRCRRCRPSRPRRLAAAARSSSDRARSRPLGGAGGPPRRPRPHLPVERDGGTHFVAGRRHRRRPRQRPLHLHLRRHDQAVLPAAPSATSNRGSTAAASSASIAATSSTSIASSGLQAGGRQRR